MKKGNRVVAIIILAILVCVLGFLLLTYFNSNKRAERRLKEVTKSFYKYYYEENSDKKDKDKIKVYLSSYAGSGLTINLEDMETYIDTKTVEDYKALKKCDGKKTKVTIYPKSPYGKTDYELKIKMECK